MDKENKTYSAEFLKDVQDFANFALNEQKKDKRKTKISDKKNAKQLRA